MISKEIMDDYCERTFSLSKLFMENLSKANDLVVEDSLVDFAIHNFICSVFYSIIDATSLMIIFFCRGTPGRKDNKIKMKKLIKEFNSLEKTLDSQNDFLERFTEKLSDRS